MGLVEGRQVFFSPFFCFLFNYRVRVLKRLPFPLISDFFFTISWVLFVRLLYFVWQFFVMFLLFESYLNFNGWLFFYNKKQLAILWCREREGENKKSLWSSGVSYGRPSPSDLLCLISTLQQNFSKGRLTLFFFKYCFGFLKLFAIAFPFRISILNL